MVRLNHLCDVAPGSHDASEFAFFASHGAEGSFIVELAADGDFRDSLVVALDLVDVDDDGHFDAGVKAVYVDFSIGGNVADCYSSLKDGLAVADSKGLAGFVVEVCQDTVGIVVDHVDGRCMEEGVIAER